MRCEYCIPASAGVTGGGVWDDGSRVCHSEALAPKNLVGALDPSASLRMTEEGL